MKPILATPEEAEALAALHAHGFDEPWSAGQIAGLMTGIGGFALHLPEGFILARAVAGESEIITLAVTPAARRKGVARALLQAAITRSVESGSDQMFLEVADDNVPAIALYRAFDFKPVGRRRGYYARTGGAPSVDALVMRRALNR